MKKDIIIDRQNNKVNRIFYKNRAVLRNNYNVVLAKKKRVNLNAWIVPNSNHQNVGDALSVIIVENVCEYYGIDFLKEQKATKHLYAIGSILLGYQDATIWGSGFGYDHSEGIFAKADAFLHRYYHHTDVRAVRGPETRRILLKKGIECPEVYGDPAVLLPLFYKGNNSGEKEKYIVIPHYSKLDKYKGQEHIVGTFTTDWRGFVDRIINSELVISSSLHGIILAEAYGVPAIMLKDTPSEDITKYKDWYYSTGRKEFPIAADVEEALNIRNGLLDAEIIREMQQRLLNSFPVDLWDK